MLKTYIVKPVRDVNDRRCAQKMPLRATTTECIHEHYGRRGQVKEPVMLWKCMGHVDNMTVLMKRLDVS